jgi:hypothetical protein
MKNVNVLFSAILASTITLLSCEKAEISPRQNEQKSIKQKSVLAPQIISNSVTCTIGKSGVSKFNVSFNQVTANFYNTTIYAHYKLPSSIVWSTGIAQSSFNNPNAVYTLPVVLAHNILLDVYFTNGINGSTTSNITQITTP